MNKGFTLLELIVVIIILGILATLGFTQYTKVVEKGRTAEAKTILGQLRTAELAYFQEHNIYAVVADLPINVPEPPNCLGTHYFTYDCTTAGLCTATRCTGGGKAPDVDKVAVYTVTLNAATGNWGGTAGYY